MSNLTPKKVVCLLTMLRGGSKLFHSLLDNHPQIISFPRTFQFSVFWHKIKSASLKPQEIAEIFIKDYPRFFSGEEWYKYNRYDKATQLGEEQNETFQIDTEAFFNHFTELMQSNLFNSREVFLNLNYAFQLSSKKAIPQEHIILYHIHSHYNYADIDLCLADFPRETELILCLRHPLIGIRSCLNWSIMHNLFSGAAMYHYQTNIYEMGHNIYARYPNTNLKVLPHEIVTNHTRPLMEKLVQYWNIEWNDCLLKSSIQGKLWSGNTLKPIKGIKNKPATFTPSNLVEKKDWLVLSYFFNNRLKKYDYSPIIISRSWPKDILFILGVFLPTNIEIKSFKNSFNPNFYKKIINDTYHELKDPKLLHFDYSTKKQIKKTSIKYHLSVYLFKIKMANPIVIFIFYLKRIVFMLDTIKEYNPSNDPEIIEI